MKAGPKVPARHQAQHDRAHRLMLARKLGSWTIVSPSTWLILPLGAHEKRGWVEMPFTEVEAYLDRIEGVELAPSAEHVKPKRAGKAEFVTLTRELLAALDRLPDGTLDPELLARARTVLASA